MTAETGVAGADRDSVRSNVKRRLGVLPDWCAGVARLTGMSAPTGFSEARWVQAGRDAAGLLERGAELSAKGWDALDVFGMHQLAPAARPTSWGWPYC